MAGPSQRAIPTTSNGGRGLIRDRTEARRSHYCPSTAGNQDPTLACEASEGVRGGEGTLLFEEGETLLPHDGLAIEEAVTEPDVEGYIRVAVQNHSDVPITLDEGQALGGVSQCR